MNRYISIQIGARRNYAVPLILEKAGLLEILHTDMCRDRGVGQRLKVLSKLSNKNSAIKRLLNRSLPESLINKTKTHDWAAIQYILRQKIAHNDIMGLDRASIQFDRDFCASMIKHGLGQATHVFSLFGEGLSFLDFAKQQGLNNISEIYIAPQTYRILQNEQQNFPDFEEPIHLEKVEKDREWFNHYLAIVDRFIVPSEFVLRGLQELGVSPTKCSIVPYAVNESWFKLKNKPIPKRILFVGTAGIRKGIHILGMAAHRLSHLGYEFRVVGGVSDKVKTHPLTQKLNFVGRVPRESIHKEYEKADIFVLPTLAEGSAEVIYEALASGLPVITTAAAGSVIDDSIDGLIIPARDSDALVEKILDLTKNRDKREQVAISARHKAYDYTLERYAERLLTVFKTE